MKLSVLLTISLVLVAAISLSSCQESKRERFEREAQEYTKKNCPKVEYNDPSVTITCDSLVCHDDTLNNYTYFYTIQTDSTGYEVLKTQFGELRKRLLSAVRNSVDLRFVKEQGLNIVYYYSDSKTGKKVAEFRFTPEDYR